MGKFGAKDSQFNRSNRVSPDQPYSVERVVTDPNQTPQIFQYDQIDETLPGIAVRDGWKYFKVPFLYLTEDCYEDLRVPAQNTKLNPTKSEPAFEEFTDGLYVYKFDTSNADDESLHFVVQMSHMWEEGTNLYPHIHWSPDSTNGGNVRWQFEYVVQDTDETFAGSATSETITATASGTALQHQLDGFSVIDGTNLKVSHILICRLTRLSTSDAADTFTGNACFLEFDFHFKINTLGSRQALIK